MDMTEVIQIGTLLVGLGVLYGGIRADLRRLHESVVQAHDEGRRAHKKIKRHITLTQQQAAQCPVMAGRISKES